MSLALFSYLAEAPKYTDAEIQYAAEFPHWPRVLNYPPAANVPVKGLMRIAQSTAYPDSWTKFKDFVQGHEMVELVSRKVLETAKRHLGIVHQKLYHAIEVMQNASSLNCFGIGLIALGAIGVYLTQPVITEPPRSWKRILSYGAMISGLALVALATYRLQSASNLLLKNFEISK